MVIVVECGVWRWWCLLRAGVVVLVRRHDGKRWWTRGDSIFVRADDRVVSITARSKKKSRMYQGDQGRSKVRQ